jgi:hypothetical protein
MCVLGIGAVFSYMSHVSVREEKCVEIWDVSAWAAKRVFKRRISYRCYLFLLLLLSLHNVLSSNPPHYFAFIGPTPLCLRDSHNTLLVAHTSLKKHNISWSVYRRKDFTCIKLHITPCTSSDRRRCIVWSCGIPTRSLALRLRCILIHTTKLYAHLRVKLSTYHISSRPPRDIPRSPTLQVQAPTTCKNQNINKRAIPHNKTPPKLLHYQLISRRTPGHKPRCLRNHKGFTILVQSPGTTLTRSGTKPHHRSRLRCTQHHLTHHVNMDLSHLTKSLRRSRTNQPCQLVPKSEQCAKFSQPKGQYRLPNSHRSQGRTRRSPPTPCRSHATPSRSTVQRPASTRTGIGTYSTPLKIY